MYPKIYLFYGICQLPLDFLPKKCYYLNKGKNRSVYPEMETITTNIWSQLVRFLTVFRLNLLGGIKLYWAAHRMFAAN